MTQADALAINRDLFLAGRTWLGWKPVERVEDHAVPAAPRPRAEGPPAGLADALVALGHKRSEAKRLAATIEGGTVEEGIRRLYAKELVQAGA
jgi:hypothetical protein